MEILEPLPPARSKGRLFNDAYFNRYLGGKDRIYEIVDGPTRVKLDRMLKKGEPVPFQVCRVLPDNARGEVEEEWMPVSHVIQSPSAPDVVELSHPIYTARYSPRARSGLLAVIM